MNQTSKIRVRAVDFVLYPVSDFTRATKFYRETLGLQQEMCNDEWKWAEFNCGNLTLALKGGEEVSKQPCGGRVALAVEDVRAACANLRSAGVQIRQEPVDFGVCCMAEVLDPDGNVVMLHRRADGTCGNETPPKESGQSGG